MSDYFPVFDEYHSQSRHQRHQSLPYNYSHQLTNSSTHQRNHSIKINHCKTTKMVPAAAYSQVGPKVLPIILTVGGATVASRSVIKTNQYREPVRAKTFQNTSPQPRSQYFEKVLESIFA
ncbi:unnamed protein product [Fusarium graminearum]|uniref:Chromosome 4, complete genome n=2 Tax=Fusarium sambucinum species complex TaxID=569360 RepID=I1S9J0_GIBZE|nr:hypothetical protein FGSG_13521 [Fusarium graminearum PH-1]CAF3644739.1 unnamed protein product [Fusarium graminearum]ESU15684.1 hypothetical protein FGSG_13521 [Fusarium graminearum PH-1]CAG1994934.1 unnamed protein product [Fusarium graminearum]CEF84359.1 unnamed protein product [Fusarium graminearum]CZS74811.1 unnamed protein product [Fusarium graminearum]|eukprot:XP_011328632.1 hypothetical protein FGSG_13521 [Fusarium graminearum PH-1]